MKKAVTKKMAKGGTLAPSKNSTSTNLASYKRTIGKNTSGKAKYGKTMMKGGKCKMGC
jgi:hypothetical protein